MVEIPPTPLGKGGYEILLVPLSCRFYSGETPNKNAAF